MKLPYSEGTWFCVSLRKGGFAAGLVARATKRGRVILCYFFGRYEKLPTLDDVASLAASGAVLVARVGDLKLMNGEWKILGSLPSWRRECWPMPLFARRESLSSRIWLIHRSDVDPNKIASEELLSEPAPDSLREDSVFGSGAVEIVLTKRLS